MYSFLLFFHSLWRWPVLASLLYSLLRAYTGYKGNRVFGKTDNALRHWTATIAHIQLIVGFTLYIKSPVVAFFFSNLHEAAHHHETLFFGSVHILLMLAAIVLITIGSAMAKRKQNDKAKHKTMLIWFGLALLLIFLAVPWPFSPLANRPYIRDF